MASLTSTRLPVGAILLSALLLGCSELSYQRVMELPVGSQIDPWASSFHAVVRTPRVRFLYSAPYAEVWNAAKAALEQLKQTGTEPQLDVDEEHGAMILRLDHRDDTAKTMDNPNPIRIKGWREEIHLEFSRQPRDRTLVLASRLVLGVPFNRRCHEYADPCPKPILFEPEVSNGQVERWILTQIVEAVAKSIRARAGASGELAGTLRE
jgi:hypothetical protein